MDVLNALAEITEEQPSGGRRGSVTSVWQVFRVFAGHVLRGRGRWPVGTYVAFDAAVPAHTRDRVNEMNWVFGDVTVPDSSWQDKFVAVEILPEAK
jgi:hypothetical protein